MWARGTGDAKWVLGNTGSLVGGGRTERERVKGAKGRVAALDLEKLAGVGGNSMKFCLPQAWQEPNGRSSAALGPHRRGAGVPGLPELRIS